MANKNAHNASGVIIDNKSMSVAAYVGSHNENSLDGQNDGLVMSRNVGSTLKPFIFSLGLDQGFITPKKEMIDTEIFIGEYSPRNHNSEFFGIISATEALALSLNIPAVNLNHKLKENSLYEMLRSLNLVKNPKEFYGDSISLGSAEMSLLNLARLYTIYANGGELKRLEVAGKIIGRDERIISPQSAYLTAKMLSSAARSYLGVKWLYAKDTPRIAFKTGTSYGSKDIYAIGVNKNYTIAVWFGNFSGKKTKNLSGFSDASKVVFDIFKILAQQEKLDFMDMPDGIEEKETCLDVFKFKECKNVQIDELIAGVELKDDCESIRSEEVDFLLKTDKISKQDIKDSPCFYKFKNYKPLIASPFNEQVIMSNEDITKVMLKCYAYIGDEIYYKIDGGEFVKSLNAAQNVIFLDRGEHKISCLDENSNFNEIKMEIRRF